MKFVAIGRTRILLKIIEALVEKGHTAERIVTCEPADFYRVDAEDFEQLATEIGCGFAKRTDIQDPDFLEELDSIDAPVAVSVNWKTIIGREVLNSFEHGIINYHAGDLPRYRGNAAMNWALLAGEDEIVHTLHFMSEELDAGPILEQRSMAIDEGTKIGDVYAFAEREVPEMCCDVIDSIQEGSIDPRTQPEDPSEVLRCYPRIPKDSQIDWSESAATIDRLVRASSEPLFGAFTYRDREKLTIWRARPEFPDHDYLGTPGQVAEIRPSEGDVAIITGDGFLVLEEVESEDGPRQPAAEVVTSHRTRLGMDVTGQLRALRDEIAELEEKLETR